MTKCGRCSTDVSAPTWFCWWCGALLCSACGDGIGHCGDAEAEGFNDESAKTATAPAMAARVPA